MGGEIYAQSVEGEGSDFIFEIRLPFSSKESSNDTGNVEVVSTKQRLAVVGMSDPISNILREMFDAYQVNASFLSLIHI